MFKSFRTTHRHQIIRSFRQTRQILLFACLLLLLPLLMAVSLFAAPVNEGVPPIHMTEPTVERNSHSATLLADGRVLVAGGWNGSVTLSNSEIYDILDQSWHTIGDLNMARAFHTAVLLSNGQVLVTGGWDAIGHALASVEVFDPATNTWSLVSELRNSRAGHVSIKLQDGRILIAAGCYESGARQEAEILDPTTFTWQSAGALVEGRCNPTATLLADGRVLLVGGRNWLGQALSSAEIFNPSLNSWEPAAPLLTPREGHSATLIKDGVVLVAGGYNGEYLSSAELYDPIKNTWSETGVLAVGRAYHTTVMLQNDKVLVIGGAAGLQPNLEMESYHPQSQKWTPAGRLTQTRIAHTSSLLSDGSLLIIGAVEDKETIPAETPEPRPHAAPQTPQPGAIPTASNRGANSVAAHDADNATSPQGTEKAPSQSIGAMAMSVTSASMGNFSEGTETARLFGVHEVSFQVAPEGNPHERIISVTFTPPLSSGANDVRKVFAFYDYTSDTPNPVQSTNTWKARVYIDRVGTWCWSWTSGGTTHGPYFFQAEEAPTSNLRGMLRVSPGASGQGKRWYTDDGRTFVPMADTAYLLFLDSLFAKNPPANLRGFSCPSNRTTAQAAAFLAQYVSEVKAHGINMLRVLPLGTWAYEGRAPLPTETPEPPGMFCETDLSLLWASTNESSMFRIAESATPQPAYDGATANLLDGGPYIAADLAPAAPNAVVYYPNLEAFKNTDNRLIALLNAFPDMYVQFSLLPEPNGNGQDDTPWNTIAPELRKQLLRTMVARWAAFPNVFFTISNDLDDTLQNNRLMLQQGGCYFGGAQSQCDGVEILNPWRANRPVSGGHLRNQIDAWATDAGASWNTYITAYSQFDSSAQQIDGATPLPQQVPTAGNAVFTEYEYANASKPVLNTEDRYEQTAADGSPEYTNPDYFYRFLFWSHLLSGSGATYGANTMWRALDTYSQGRYNGVGCPSDECTLRGLNSIGALANILDSLHIDMAMFRPNDSMVQKLGGSDRQWAEFARGQAAVRGKQELLLYAPNPASNTQPWPNVRRSRTPSPNVIESLKVDLEKAGMNDAKYQVSIYRPNNATPVVIATLERSGANDLLDVRTTYLTQATPQITGDFILHLSSRCVDPNICEPMDALIPPAPTPGTPHTGVITSTAGFQIGDDESAILNHDADVRVAGSHSWRCDRPTAPGEGFPGCWVRYDFPSNRTIASADFYYRRNSLSAYQGLYFITKNSTDKLPDEIVDGNEATSINVWIGPGGDLHLEAGGPNNNAFTPKVVQNAATGLNRWYHVTARVERTAYDSTQRRNTYSASVFVDGIPVISADDIIFAGGDIFFRRTIVHSAWWGPTYDLPAGSRTSVWWDELSIDPPSDAETQGLYHSYFQQGLGGYHGTQATYFDGAAGYDGSSYLRVGANNYNKSLLRFNVAGVPNTAVIDEATLSLYYVGRSNANSLTLGASGVLDDWSASDATRIQRLAGVNWSVAGMGAGSDYASSPVATSSLSGEGNTWIDLDVTALAQTWVSDATQNHGIVLQQSAANGYVVYSFCSEVVQAPTTPPPPCVSGHEPRLTLRYHLVAPTPAKAVFQAGAGGYAGFKATYFDYVNNYNNSPYLRVSSDNNTKSLLRFDLTSIPITQTVVEATLRLYPVVRSNGNSLTVTAHQVLADWNDGQANRVQRQSGVNWQIAGLGPDSDYRSQRAGSGLMTGIGTGWIEVNLSDMVRAWVANPADNHGLVLLAQAASGAVNYGFCSELGWSPCTPAQAPILTVWSAPPQPTPPPEE